MNKGSLVIVGTGIQWAGQTTPAAQNAIAAAERVLFAVVDPWTARWIRELNPEAESLPYPLDDTPRRDTYREMVERILAEVRRGWRVCTVFYGHPGVLTTPSHEAVRLARAEGFNATMLPGVSSIDCLFADLGVDPCAHGCQIYEAADFLARERIFDPRSALILCQIAFIGNPSFFTPRKQEQVRNGLKALSDHLVRHLPPNHEVTIYEAAKLPVELPRVETTRIDALADAEVTDLSTLYVPPYTPPLKEPI